VAIAATDIKRVIVIVLDSVGIGALPDADEYGDEGANTLGNLSRVINGLKLPHLEKLGLGKIESIEGLTTEITAMGAYGKMAEKSKGKDTTTGHWELAGIVTEEPFPTYPNGFPDEIIDKFTDLIGCGILGNKPASGTKIIGELGEVHLKTGKPIVYTSADSVFQIAAHEKVIPIERLYEICKIARSILTGKHAVGRVIARPFIGEPGNFNRTDRREDFSLLPPQPTMLDKVKKAGQSVQAVGKIIDIFAGQGVTESNHTVDNMESVDAMLAYMETEKPGLLFVNLVEFDMNYGHRRNPKGYAAELEAFDLRLPEILSNLQESDVLMITADHGCDPTFSGTDHTREYVPLLVYGEQIKKNYNLGIRESYSDMAVTITELLGVNSVENGKSFVDEILEVE